MVHVSVILSFFKHLELLLNLLLWFTAFVKVCSWFQKKLHTFYSLRLKRRLLHGFFCVYVCETEGYLIRGKKFIFG